MATARAETLFVGSSQLAELMRATDWAATPVGPAETWPQSVRAILRLMLTSRYAMWMGWGPQLTFFYNDAYATMTLGAKHPWALGKQVNEVWADRVEGARGRTQEGTGIGIGLALVHELVKLHGGTIAVDTDLIVALARYDS